MKKKLFVLIIFAVCLVLSAHSFADDDENRVFDITYEDVFLRQALPGMSSEVITDIHVRVFVNEEGDDDGATALAVHGFVHTAATWQPLVRELFRRSEDISRVVAIDLPGHGESDIKSGVFGTLTLNDYVRAIFLTLKRLDDSLKPSVIVAHSQGALVVQMMQAEQELAELGIAQVVLLAAAAPKDIPWEFAENGTAATVLTNYLCPNAANLACLDESVWGPHVAFPDSDWIFLFFTNLDRELAAGAPWPKEVYRKGYIAPAPLFASANLIGFPPFDRPVVGAGVFAQDKGTSLTMVTYENDIIVRPDENRSLYEHLTGDPSLFGVTEIEGADTVHDLHISDPGSVADTLCEIIDIDDDDDDDDDDNSDDD